jgi:hypothetical protein
MLCFPALFQGLCAVSDQACAACVVSIQLGSNSVLFHHRSPPASSKELRRALAQRTCCFAGTSAAQAHTQACDMVLFVLHICTQQGVDHSLYPRC